MLVIVLPVWVLGSSQRMRNEWGHWSLFVRNNTNKSEEKCRLGYLVLEGFAWGSSKLTYAVLTPCACVQRRSQELLLPPPKGCWGSLYSLFLKLKKGCKLFMSYWRHRMVGVSIRKALRLCSAVLFCNIRCVQRCPSHYLFSEDYHSSRKRHCLSRISVLD